MKKIIMFMLVFLLTGCSVLADKTVAIDPNDKIEIEYEVKSGSNLTVVAKELESMGLILDSKAMIKYATENDRTNIKAGTYLISKSMTPMQMADKFYSGDVFNGKKFVVQEGLEAIQIAEKIEAEGLGGKEKFMELVNNPKHFASKYEFLNDPEIVSLEGYLYPLTYSFKDTDGEESIINTMLNSFDIVYKSDIKPLLDNSDKSLNDVIILASIVEREAALEDEMPLVASVFQNRVNIDMKLESCATVQYILKERKWILSAEDIAIDSPYNTYMYKGLPVTAIASPSLSAIKAAINPPETDYMFFLSKNDGTGSQVFSKTYEEHLQNKQKYLG